MWVPVAVWQVRLRTTISVHFTLVFTTICCSGTARRSTRFEHYFTANFRQRKKTTLALYAQNSTIVFQLIYKLMNCTQGLNWGDLLIWDPLPLITDPVPHNWDPAPLCWDPPLCWVESKDQTLFKCHKSQTECLECTKTPGRRSGTPPLFSALRARALVLQASCL